MSDLFRKGVAGVAAMKPVTGRRPKTESEWKALLRAYEQMLFFMLRGIGLGTGPAKEISKSIFSGPAGQMLLDIAMPEKPNE